MKKFPKILSRLIYIVIFIICSFLLNQGLISCAAERVVLGYDASEPNYSTITDDRDGKIYKTVAIGDQVWMAENLAYAPTDGSIPHVASSDSWSALSYDDLAYCYFNNDSSLGYGCLYTWAAAMDRSNSSSSNRSEVQGVCPSGWHLPSYSEWLELEDYLTTNGYNYDGSTMGNKISKSMASKTRWSRNSAIGGVGSIGDDSTPNNSSGFSALPGGSCSSSGVFNSAGSHGYWWSTLRSNSVSAYHFKLSYNNQNLNSEEANRNFGYSVRCLRN